MRPDPVATRPPPTSSTAQIVGSGARLFTDGTRPATLALIDATPYPLGVVQLTYRPEI
jgi:hypothetical protein